MNSEILKKASDNMRVLSIAMVEKAKSGHPGGALGGMDFITVLFSEFLFFDPSDMTWPNRDRFFLDPGHMSPMLYSILSMFGCFSMDDLSQFRQLGSPTPGHPEVNFERGIENTSGPLGQGHAMALGAAIAERFLSARFGDWMSHKIYTFISDGGVQEGISQCTGRLAGHLGLSNLIMFYDSNSIQLSTETRLVSSEDTAKKYEAWGWKVVTINGNDFDEIRSALRAANEEKERPFLIIGKTIMGKGLVAEDGRSFEEKIATHGMPISKAGASVKKSIENLGGDPDVPFKILPEVAAFFKKVRASKTTAVRERKEREAEWVEKNPEQAERLQKFLSMELPKIDYASIKHDPNIPSRNASGNILAHFSGKIENMIVASADLSNSDKTEGFLKNTKPFEKGDFSGAFLHAGVSELSMAAIINGMALHGGVISACGTFFVFSDYMKPAIRMSALMELPVKYIWSHDAFRVGEDGPTHQPIEQEAQIRLLEKVRNHSGRRSLLVLRPADSMETNVAWEMAMENTKTPTALIFSRQNIKDIPARPGSTREEDARGAKRGAYIVKGCEGRPEIILVGNGSEVSTLYDGGKLLMERNGIRVRIVSVISDGLFFDQEESYRDSVLSYDIPIMGLTAGLSVVLEKFVGLRGKILGLNEFGYSAPFKVLDEKFGFTPENVFAEAVKYLSEFYK